MIKLENDHPDPKPPAAQLNQDISTLETVISTYFQANQKLYDSINKSLDEYLQIKPNSLILSNPSWPYCKNGHPLTWEKIDSHENPCIICQTKIKISFWNCKTCKDEYCAKCYAPFLKKGKCPLNHSMISVLSIFEKCSMCAKTLKLSGVMDLQCKIALCQGCKEKISQ